MTTHRKDLKMHRKSAEYLLRRTTNLIKVYNADIDSPLEVRRLVVFGSYANSDKEMLSDLDLALRWAVRKENWDKWIEEHLAEMCKFYGRKTKPEIYQIYDYMKRKALIYFRQRSGFIQFTTLDLPEE